MSRSSIQIFNSLGRELQEFEPQDPDQVRMYVCGVTVYDDCHVGHGRAYVVFDVIRRFLEHEGYPVKFVENFTDVDDKIINRANETDRNPEDIAREFTRAYFDAMDRLNIRRADVYPSVSGHVEEIVEHVQGLVDRGLAYEVDGDVFFEVEKFPEYGKLSGQDPEEMEAGERVEVNEKKRDPLDFTLWKSSKPGEPSWESPWGEGRPGWHIECSVMSRTHLGDTMDIHGGGRDLIFPHHENEIAQSEGLTGQTMARYWVHNGFVTIDEEKMSKSEGNFFTLKELYRKFSPAVIRYFILTRHYRSPLDFSFDRLVEAREARRRLIRLFQRLNEAESWSTGGPLGEQSPPDLREQREDFLGAMREDFNTAQALGHLQQWAKEWNRTLGVWEKKDRLNRRESEAISAAREWMEEALGDILGVELTGSERDPGAEAGDGEIEQLVELCLSVREKAREEGNYEVADDIREGLREAGFELQDTPRGTRWERVRD